MMEVRVFILFVFLAVDVNGGRVYRIIGGADASEGEFPYQVQLLQNGWFICGGSIISSDFILTAAHCINKYTLPFMYEIIAGTRELGTGKGQSRTVKKIYRHEEWNYAKSMQNDIALLKLNEPLEFNDNVKPIGLPTEDISEGLELVSTGWGDTSYPGNGSQILQKSIAKVFLWLCKNSIEETKFCAYSGKQVGTCKGDSGGPIVLRNKYIVGIASYTLGDCATGRPDIFTRVYKYVDWIQEHMNKA